MYIKDEKNERDVVIPLHHSVIELLERQAKSQCITFEEHCRHLLGYHYMQFMTQPVMIQNVNRAPFSDEQVKKMERQAKLYEAYVRLNVELGPYKCPKCTQSLTEEGLINNKCEKCGAPIFESKDPEMPDGWKPPGMGD